MRFHRYHRIIRRRIRFSTHQHPKKKTNNILTTRVHVRTYRRTRMKIFNEQFASAVVPRTMMSSSNSGRGTTSNSGTGSVRVCTRKGALYYYFFGG